MNTSNRFVQLKDVINHVYLKVNLMGVVMEFGIPKKSRGTDYVSVLKIVDESQQSPELSVHIFTETLDELPHIKSHGDLIILYCVVIKKHKGVACAVFNKNVSSFALLDGKFTIGLYPYQASSGCGPLDPDKDFIARLRKWCLSSQFSAGTSKYLLSLKDFKAGNYFDLVCKVLHICEVSKDVWMLFVWDGTDTPPLSLHMKLEDEEHNPLPLQIESSPLPRDVFCSFPRFGTILRVTADQAYKEFNRHFRGNGKWVRIRNITCEVRSGLWHGLLTPSSKVRLLSNTDSTMLECKRNCTKRIREKGRVPLWSNPSCSLTVTDDEHVPFSTLMDVLTCSEVNANFRCIVRVVAVYPSQAKDFCSTVGSYKLRLTLEDPTARIHALICSEDGVTFFKGYPPVDVLTMKMNKLLGVLEGCHGNEDSDSPRSPPWVQCCIRSCDSNTSDAWGSRQYHICNTKLVTS